MPVSQNEIDGTIILEEGKLISNIIAAAKTDSRGDWKGAICKLKAAEKSALNIAVLETKCDADISEFVNENTQALVCDLENDTGIGKWAIAPSARGCNVFKIRKSQSPPPYGEFSQLEFVVNEVTEVTTS